MAEWLLDGLLIAGLVLLTHGALRARDLMHAAVCFIAFGLFMALVWVRLRAPDVALAEAAIGAGLGGALLLDTLRHVGAGVSAAAPARTSARWLALLMIAPALALAPAVRLVDRPAEGLAPAVAAELGRSGVSHPVTAVLLNFRAYDTLLEIGVLLLAALGVLALGRLRAPAALAGGDGLAGPIALAMVRVGVPLCVLVAGYLLWAGGHRPGGAFQAAAVLAGGAILWLLVGAPPLPRPRGWHVRLALGGGLAIFLLVGLGAMARGRLLELPPAVAPALILIIETGLTLSLAVILTVLFLGAAPPAGGGRGGGGPA